MSLTKFIHMGGYAFYVWSAYACAALILMGNVLWSLSSKKRIQTKIQRYLSKQNYHHDASST